MKSRNVLQLTQVVLITVIMSTIPGFAQARASTHPDTMIPSHAISTMSFNVRYGTAADRGNSWQYRKQAVVEIIRKNNPDLLGVQEALAFQMKYLEKNFTEYDAVGDGRDDGESSGEHTGIFFRKSRFEALSSGTFWFSETPRVPGSSHWGNRHPRICTWVRLSDRETGQVFSVYNVHLDHGSRLSREKSIAMLIERMSRRPNEHVILMGDFNSVESSRALRTLTTTSTTQRFWIDTFREIHPNALRCGTITWFTGLRFGPRIDYILATSGTRVHNARIIHGRIDGRLPSDHFPVSALVSFPTDTHKIADAGVDN